MLHLVVENLPRELSRLFEDHAPILRVGVVAKVGTLIDEQANVLDVTATILDFAMRRHLLIRELPLAQGVHFG